MTSAASHSELQKLNWQYLDREIDPFLRSLGDRYFRNVADDKRLNKSKIAGDAQTDTDLAIEADVRVFLGGLWNVPILGEEANKESDAPFNASTYWIVDPVDGTVYFERLEYGEFGTLISLVEDGEIVAAWGYLPGKTKAEDIIAKSITFGEVLINDVPVQREWPHKDAKDALGRGGISKNADYVTPEERAQVERNREAVGMLSKPRVPGHGTFLFAQGKMDYYGFIGINPWDYTVMAKFVTAFGGQVFKFTETQSACAYEGEMILNEKAGMGVVMPGVDYNAVIPPLFIGTRWEETCKLTLPM